jgi:hypothetical protein
MGIEKYLTTENLKETAKITAALAAGIVVAKLAHETGIPKKMAEYANWHETGGTRFLHDIAVPFGTYVYDSLAGIITAGAVYLGLDKCIN